MADSLLTMTEALNGVPDNTSNLVTPQNVREALLSVVADHGVAGIDQATAPITVPLATGVWTDIPQAINANGGAMISGELPLYWRMDANGHLYYDYAADWPNVEVEPGYTRSVSLTALLEVDLAGAADLYGFRMSVDGVGVGATILVEEASQTDTTVVLIESQQALIVADAPIVSVQAQNSDSPVGFDVYAFGFRCIGGPPA